MFRCCLVALFPFGMFAMTFYNANSDAYFIDFIRPITHDMTQIFGAERNATFYNQDFIRSLSLATFTEKEGITSLDPNLIVPIIGCYLFAFIWMS